MRPERIRRFNYRELDTLSFGDVEGENDSSLADSFMLTSSIIKMMQRKFNYVLAPRGVGKSAVFRALEQQYISKEHFNYETNHIIPVNKAFVYDNEYISLSKFKNEGTYKDYLFSWALYFISVFIKDIRDQFSSREGYSSFRAKVAVYENFKESFQLYSLADYINQFNLGLSFTVNGVALNLVPKFKIDKPRIDVSVTDLFGHINAFYKSVGQTAIILIDKLDDFVSREEYSVQRRYIQGVFDCIEEMRTLSNICPILFVRTDLFYNLELNKGYDKVAPRILNLEWSRSEILFFIVRRFMSNQYIRSNYAGNFMQCASDLSKPKSKYAALFNRMKIALGRTQIADRIVRNQDYLILITFLKIFLPIRIKCPADDGHMEECDFFDWFFRYFTDQNGLVNPRVVVFFFNKLFQNQFLYYNSNQDLVADKEYIVQKRWQGMDLLGLFTYDVIDKTFKETQDFFLKTIYFLLKDPAPQRCFLMINEFSTRSRRFKHGDIEFGQCNLTRQEYAKLLAYLKILGFIKERTRRQFEVPLFYASRLTIVR